MNGSSLAQQMEPQTPRQLRRYLDYGKRVKRGEIDEEFGQWLVRIITDDEIYGGEERALALEVAACEYVADIWDTLEKTPTVHLFIAAPVERLSLYLGMIDESLSWEQRASYWHYFREKYPKNWAWIRQVYEEEMPRTMRFCQTSTGQLFAEYCRAMKDETNDRNRFSNGANPAIQRLEQEVRSGQEALKTMEADLEFAEDRAERAHARLKKLDEEMQRIRRQLNDERENGEKLRNERKVRISSQREFSQAQKELEILRQEYVRMQGRLKEMANRLSQSEPQLVVRNRWSLDHLRAMDRKELLGLQEGLDETEDLGKTRRQFASALHPDRVRGLPPWTGALFSEVMRIVNEACDRKK